MKNLLTDLLDVVYPTTCPGCNQPLVSGEQHLCVNCSLNLPLHTDAKELMNVFAGRIKVEGVYVLLKFIQGGITQKLLHEIKYRGNTSLGDYLGRRLGENCLAASLSDVDVIVPVPLHKGKLKLRGYNQSEVIGRGLANVLEKPINFTSVVRSVKNQTQTRKTRAERWQNVSGIFRVVNKKLEGKHVLLIDDVLTTGATMEACGQTLLSAGASRLSIAALAAAI